MGDPHYSIRPRWLSAALLTVIVALSGCQLLASLSPYKTVPGWGTTYTGELPPDDDIDDLASAFDQVVRSYPAARAEEIKSRIGHIEIWWRKSQLVKNRVANTDHPGLFYEPKTIEIAVGNRRRVGDTALVYEVYRVLHRHLVGPSLTSAQHQDLYGARIARINDCVRHKKPETSCFPAPE